MKLIQTGCMIIFILLIAGCGTAGQVSSATEQLEANHVHKHEHRSVSLTELTDVGYLTNGNRSTSEKTVTSTSIENDDEGMDDVITVSPKDVSDSQAGKEQHPLETVEDDIFIQLAKEYNNMYIRIEPEVDFEHFYQQYVGYKFTDIKTKEQLYEKFSDMMTREAADKVWGSVIKQGDDGLYLIPTDGPPRFDENNPYTIEQLDSQTYQLQQTHKSELHGVLELEFTFTLDEKDNKWKISDLF